MSPSKVGRNEPCPCGSGKKFKHCCSDQSPPPGSSGASDLGTELRAALAGQNFGTLADAQAFTERFTQRHNRAPNLDFHGLSSEQMFSFLHHPFESPPLVRFVECLEISPTAPIMTLFGLLTTGIAEQDLKATAKGNLPRDFCRAAALAALGEADYREHTKYAGINREDDYYDLHITRLIGELAGFIRRHKGRFILSRECRTLLDDGGPAAIYPRLLRTYTQKFNWAYGDGYPALALVQQSFLFTLHLLVRHGETERSQVFYEDAFIRAFPVVLNEIEPSPYSSAEDTLRACYTRRAMMQFAAFFGFAKIEIVGTPFDRKYLVTKLSLLDAAVRFRLET